MSSGFKINKAYAEKYNTWRQKEELQKLKDRYGDEDSDESSSSESEDEDAEALTEQLERGWLRTLSALKSKDPRIYEKDVKFYEDDDKEGEDEDKTNKKDKNKPMFLKDYDRKVILEKGGMISDSDSSDDGEEEGETPAMSRPAYQEELEDLRKSVVAAAGNDSDEDSDHGLLKRREKTAEEKKREDADYLEWLKDQNEALDESSKVSKDLAPLKRYWQNKNLDEGEKFLKNYILNREYIDKDERMPTYSEIVDDEFEQTFSDEEELLTNQANFERKYNFRFEEPDCAEVKTYPRNFEESVRRKDTKRQDKRKLVEERKKMEKEKKKDELKQLKKLKRQEILDKIEKLKEITGNTSLGIDVNELDDDFDPSKHDQMMQDCFDDQYYQEGEGEEEKPVFEMSDDEYDGDNWDEWKGDNYQGDDGYYDNNWNQEPGAEDPNFIMDADYDPVADMERKQKKKEKKKKNKLSQALSAKKPVFDPNEKTFEEYFDDYYKLDFEDIIDDMPCRFKYRKVMPNTFGLTVDEILKCRDKELNAWVSVKRMSQYRTEDEEQYDLRSYRSKGKNFRKKQNVLPSLFEKEEKDENEKDDQAQATGSETQKESKSKRKRKRKAKKKQLAAQTGGQNDNGENVETMESEEKEVNHINDSEKCVESADSVDTVDDSEKTAEDSPKKRKRKAEESLEESEEVNDLPEKKKSKKKKKKQDKEDVGVADTNVDSEKRTESHMEKLSKTRGDESNKDLSNNVDSTDKEQKRKKKNKKKNKNKDGYQKPRKDQKPQMSEDRLKAYGINPMKYKYMTKEDLFTIKPRTNYE